MSFHRPVHPPAITEDDLGARGWACLHDLAEVRCRPPRLQVVALLRWAVHRALEGDETELTRAQLAGLLGSTEQLEPVA
jgi:hypothetical protein